MSSSSSTSITAATGSSLVTYTHTFSVKLTSKNYLAWKTQFLPILNYQNLHGHIDGASSPPPKTAVSPTAENLLIPNLEYEAWFKKDQLLLSWLFSSLTEEIFPYIIGLSTSQEVWTALAHSFGSASQNRQLQLYIELQELKKNDLSISEYLHKTKSLSDELSAAGKPVTPAEFNAIIYRNIGFDYHSIITALNLRQEPVSFYELHGQLVAHEILLKHSLTPTANIVLKGSTPLLPTPPFSSTFRPRTNSQYNNQPSNNYGRRNRGPCQICGLTNHIALTCRSRYVPRQQNQSPRNNNFSNRNFNASANYSNVAPPLNWFPDTAANYHLTPDINALNAVNEYMGNDQLHVGNGQGLQITHTARHARFHEHDFPYDAAHQSSPSAAVSTPWLNLSHSVSHLDSPSISGLSPSPTSSPQSPSPILFPSPASSSDSSTSSPTHSKTPSSTFTPNLTQPLSTTSPQSTSSHSPILSHRQPQLSSSIQGLNLIVDLINFSNSSPPTDPISPPRTHTMTLRPSTMTKRQANLAQTSPTFLYIEPKTGRIQFYILVYVDDIVLTCSDHAKMEWFLHHVKLAFPVRDLGPLHYFLGIQVKQLSDGILLTQEKYLEDLLKETHMGTSTPCYTPLAVSPPLSKTMGVYLPHPEQYRQVIGALQYLTLTRPDIAFAVNKLAQFMHCATDVHWQAAKRLLRYLRGTSAMGLFITKHSSLQLQCFSDSDWAGCPDDRRSTGGYLVYLGKNLISWSSKKQPTVARSSTESEYKAIANVTAEIMWIGSLLYELGVPKALPALLWCDNIGAIYLSSNPIFHARTKHVELDYHFVREQVKLGTLVVRFISSADQLADIMTKPLGTRPFHALRHKLRLHQISPSA
ncbi:hypothetical protein RJ640_028945 [Escallonia rubra]|uniref:Reverse transcriptase Ty1/copia-type domain-containing protein n=1 Tax=Escallonia rubra TaxID=112253 RepID=A0AA88RXT7_9ASTE|nr:hypothetical protein RJ640_028945 [Escallonia rubra]